MHANQLATALAAALTELKTHADELRDLDQALGDGDLGITVSLGADAVVAALAELPEEATPTEVIRTCARAFANANPSTMAALVAGGLLAGSRVWDDADDITVALAGAFARAAAENIGKRGKSAVGDKTILDALAPAASALENAPGGAGAALDAAIAAAEKGVVDTRDMQSQRGRASWLQERSIGLQDPGATAMWRFLESWKRANA
ncbi:DAK2 domain-containing protein [Microbacterium sp. G2-8]|uniref:DAK2 domain-containing protein n=1 Tax=Microbacterium sp. G2-8 TaxID=2842454 RepID=UPI001C8AF585|nr:DAK2 domain-containing protein [Microbacterium sp. G2-8]